MGHARLSIWLQFLRRFGVGVAWIYAGVVLTAGGTSVAATLLYTLSGIWLAVVLLCTATAIPGVRVVRWLDLFATNVAIALLLAEFALQTYAATPGGALLVRSDLDAYRLIPGHEYGDGLRGNRLGYPGPELPAVKKSGIVRIAALGDSFAVGPAVPFADNFLTRLATELTDVEVGNFGVSGAGPREYREILCSDVWAVQPDIVLVNVFVGNDITEALPRPRHLDPRQHALYLLCERGFAVVREKRRTSIEPVTVAPSRLSAPALSPQTFREVEARRLAVCLKDSTASMEKKWQRTLADLEGIIGDCRNRGAKVVVVLIPDEFQVNESVLQNAVQDAGVVREQLDLDGPQRRLQAFFDQRGVPCLDLLRAFRAVPDTYAPCDTHWNVTGNHLAACEIAAWLRGLRLNQIATN